MFVPQTTSHILACTHTHCITQIHTLSTLPYSAVRDAVLAAALANLFLISEIKA